MLKIKFSKKQINQFKQMGIDIVYLFGSYAQERASALSDVDIGIVFKNPERHKDNTMNVYLKLYNILTDVLPEKYLKCRFKMREHDVDIVFLQFAPLNLQFSAIKDGVALYERDIKAKFYYHEEVMKRIADIQYFYDLRCKAILERI